MKPVCVRCERFMRAKKNGYAFVEGKPHGDPTTPWDCKVGAGSQGWTPYKLWIGDLWECPTCLAQIVVGVMDGHGPVAEHYQPEFKSVVTQMGATLLVKDC